MKKIKKYWCLKIFSLMLITLSGCNELPDDNSTLKENRPKVVSTSTIISDLTETIAEDEINHISILKPGDDPHMYEPVPQDSIALEKANLILYNGYNLEPGLIKLINSAGIKAEKIPVAEVVKPLDFEYKGQIKPDPHVWGDPKNAILMVELIRDQLIEISPEDETKFKENAAKLIQELQNLDQWITEQINTIPPQQRKLITTHDAFKYYGEAYGLEIPGTLIGISTEEQPSAKTVKQLVEIIKNNGIKAIFAETTINPILIKTVAEEAGVVLAEQQLYSDSLGVSGSEGDSYIKMLQSNTNVIVKYLK